MIYETVVWVCSNCINRGLLYREGFREETQTSYVFLGVKLLGFLYTPFHKTLPKSSFEYTGLR